MEKTIKYLENGEYHYATVKDVGDLAKLKTDSKDDLVTAINELFITGGEAPKKPDGYDELVDNVADAIQKQQQMTDTITNMQQSAQLSDAEMEHMKQVQEELHQEYLKAIKELNEAVDKAKADAANLDKKTSDLQDKLDETFANVDKEVSDVHKQLDSESAGLRKDLDDTKTSLESTRKDLLNNTQEFGVVNSEVKELKDKMDRRIWSTDLDPVREQVNKNTTEVSQTKDELKNKADQSSLDLVTNSVENLSTQIKENAEGLKVAVKKDELGGDVARLLNDKTNLLLGTRNFSGDSWGNKTHWHEEPGYWKGLKVFSSTERWFGLQYKYEVKQGQQYTFSFWARQEKDNSSASIVLSESDKGDQGITTPYTRGVHIGTEWKRYSLTFQAESDGIIYPRVEQNVQGNKLYIAGYKLELGSVATPWEPNEADVAENIEHNESQFNVYSDQIAGIVKKQEKMGDTERQLDTRITETAEGLKQTSKDLQDANGKITEFKGQLESTARGLKTEYEKYTNDAIGQISDSSLNLIRNSAFQNKDDNFAQWQNVSAKANIREDSNGLRWVELTQSGMTTDNPQGITSNYFVIKQGKVTVAVDIKLGDKANLDNQNILLLELYDESKKRVDFTDVSVSQLGLSMSVLNDHNVHRGLYRLGIDRKDVKYMTVKAILHRNGDLWLTNFSARLSSIDDGGYTPNPDDVNHQILKMNTKIEEDAKHIALKANSVDVTRDIKSAVDGIDISGVNLLRNTDPKQIDEVESDSTWILGSFGNGSAKVIDLPNSNIFTAKHGFEIYGNTNGNRDFTQRPIHWTNNKYVFSVYARIADASFAKSVDMMTRAWSNQTNRAVFENHYTLTSKQWTRVTMSIDASSFYDQTGVSLAFGLSGYGSIDFAQPMLELANKASKWSPNPQDTSAEIKSAKDAAIQVASDQINLHVNELSTQFDDRLNKRVNEVKTAYEKITSDGIEQTVKKITDVKDDVNNVNSKLDNLQVGGRNLLHGTSDQWKTLNNNGNDWLQKTTASTCWTSTADYHTGNTFTYAAKITNNSHQQAELEIWLCDQNKNLINGQTFHAPIPKGANAYDVSVTFPITVNTWYIRSWIIFTGGNAPNGDSVQVKDERLVEGNLAGAWSPNPDDINQKIDSIKTETTASVKNLGDRVTTEVDSVTSKINNVDSNVQNQFANAVELIQKSDFSDGSKGNWTVQSIISATNPAPPAELGIPGMKVIQSNVRDSYEDVWHSVTPGEKFNIDFWCAPSGVYDSSFGLVFYDANKKLVPNNQWLGVRTDHSGQWKYYTGEIIAPSNSAFARPWFQIDMPVGQYHTSWLAKPHIRRQDPRVTEAIKEVNTKWDVANGQIQGKVTATDVNNILNGKGYATQSWAQSEFRMKSDSIELEVRKITDPISNRVNSVNSKLDNLQVGTRNLLHHSDTFDGWHKGSSVSISSEKYLNGSVAVLQNSGSGGNALYSGLDVTNDEKHITWTVYARADNNGDKLHTELWGGGGLTDQPLTTEWKRYKFTGDRADTYNSFYLWGVNTNKGNIYVALPFAVIGNTIGSWSPNPDDINQSIKDATEYKTVTGTIDFNNLKTQQKIFYKDTQATNTPAGGNYWYYLDVEPGTDGRIFQTAISDRDNITWVRTFADSWGPWIRQADQRNIDDLNNQISSFKTETTASVKNLGDRVTTEVNSVTSRVDNLKAGGQNLVADGDASAYGATPWENTTFRTHPYYYNSTKLMFVIDTSAKTELTADCPNWFPVKAGHQYTLYFNGFMSTNVSSYDVWLLGKKADAQGSWTNTLQIVSGERLSPSKNCIITKTFTVPSSWSNYVAYIRFDNNGSTDGKSAVLFFNEVSVKEGNVNTGYSPAPENTVNEIKKLNTKWDVANGQIQGKVTATDVNNILNGKGYATQSWAQSQFRMKSDSIDLEVKKITDPISNKINSVNEKDGINLLKGTSDFTGSWFRCDDASWTDDNWRDTNGNRVRKRSGSAWNGLGQTVHLEPGNYTFSLDMYLNLGNSDSLNIYAGDTQYNGTANIVQILDGNRYDHNSPQGSWFRAVCHFKVTEAGNVAIRPELNQGSGTVHVGSYKLEKGLIATPWTPAPSDNASVTQISSLQVSIDGLQSTVSNKADKSQITQLSNMIQSKVSSTDFNNLRKAVDLQTLDSADINNMKTNGHYFVRSLANNPVGGWVYVDVTGNGADRIRQDVYQDNGNKHKYRRWFGTYWTGWEEGATESEITQLRDDINLRVKSGDLLSQINLTAHNTLIQSGKIYLDSSSTVFSGKAFIPSAAIVSLDADKINTGTLNTRTVSIGDDQTRLWARSNYLYLTGKDQGNAYNMRLGGDRIEFVTTEIPNNAPYMDGITPMYQIAYDGDTKSRLKIRSFNRLTGSNEFPIEMYDSVNISKDQLDFAANNQMKMQVVDGGVNIRPTLFLQNNTRNGTWAGFTRLDNSDTVEFNTGNNNGENFHVNSGARFRQYLYVDGWLSCYQLKQTSLLSEKTDIEELDPEEALNMVRQDKQYLYKYKQDVQKGIIDQQAGLIIDDQNNTPVYTPPKVFLDSTGKSREPNVELAYLIAAFQELDRRNQKLERDIRELKGEVIHE